MQKNTFSSALFLFLTLAIVFSAGTSQAIENCPKAVKLSDQANDLVSTNPAAATNKLREAISYCGTSASLHYNLAMALYPQANYAESRAALEKALQLKPDYAKALNALAFITIKHGGDLSRAKTLARKAVELEPGNRQFADTLELMSGNVDDAPKTGLIRPDAIAIVIGIKNYENKTIPPVKYALQDAATIKRYLVDTLGFNETNVYILKDATNVQLTKYFGNDNDHKGILFNRVRRDRSDVFIFYSGHGAPDTNTKKAYLLPADADPSIMALTGYSLDTLYVNLAKLSTEKNTPSITVVLDACFSGGSNDGMLIENASPIFIEATSPSLTMKHAVVFSSSKGNQISSWYPEKGHGLFTYFFLKSIKDAAEEKRQFTAADLEKTLLGSDSVNDYAWKMYNREQEPQVFGDRNIVLVQ